LLSNSRKLPLLTLRGLRSQRLQFLFPRPKEEVRVKSALPPQVNKTQVHGDVGPLGRVSLKEAQGPRLKKPPHPTTTHQLPTPPLQTPPPTKPPPPKTHHPPPPTQKKHPTTPQPTLFSVRKTCDWNSKSQVPYASSSCFLLHMAERALTTPPSCADRTLFFF